MSPRRVRIKRLLSRREEELDAGVQHLNRSRAAKAEASHALEQQHQALEAAEAQRRRLGKLSADARCWTDVDEWLVLRASRREVAEQQVRKTNLAVVQAQAGVLAAHSNLKRMELFDQRLATAERTAENRTVRREEDELAAQSLARGKRES